MRLHTSIRTAVAAGTAVVVLGVLVGCGSGATPTQTSPPSPPAATTVAASDAACDDVAELKSSLEDLTKVDPVEDGVPALRSAIDEVKTDLAAAEGSVSDALRPSVDQVKAAFGDLQTATADLTAENRREQAPEIKAAMDKVRSSTQTLASQLRERCPGR